MRQHGNVTRGTYRYLRIRLLQLELGLGWHGAAVIEIAVRVEHECQCFSERVDAVLRVLQHHVKHALDHPISAQ